MTSHSSHIAFRDDLQGLRALAVLLVVLAHAGLEVFAGGFVGVDVFFVLSGYLISGLLIREIEQHGRVQLLQFYARRLKRLLPALIVMLLISYGCAMQLLSALEADKQLASFPYAASWTSNLYYTYTTFDYFDELSAKDLYLHTWSLGVEEQFYLIWPIFMLLVYWVLTKWQRISSSLFIIAGVTVSSFFASLYWQNIDPQATFYMMPSRVWQFSLGAMVYVFFQQEQAYHTLKQYLQSTFSLLLGLLLIIASALLLDGNMPYPDVNALFPSLGAALVIAAGHGALTSQKKILRQPLLVWLGDRSYSLYLWHWPILVIGFSLGYQDEPGVIAGLIVLSILIAAISYRYVELPFWKGRFSHFSAVKIIAFSISVIVLLISLHLYGQRHLHNNMTIDISAQSRVDVPVIYQMGCDAWYENARVSPCGFGDPQAEKTVLLLGDSILAQWFSMMPELYPRPTWRVVVLTKSSCPMVDEDWFYARLGRVYQVCTDWRNSVLDIVEQLKPEVIVMGSASSYGFSEEEWVEGSSRVVERLSAVTEKLFMIPGTPSLGFDGPGCISRNLSADGQIDQSLCYASGRMQYVDPVTEYLTAVTDRFDNAFLLDLNDLVCPEDSCAAINEQGYVVYRDGSHITDSFVRAQVPIIRQRMKELIE